MSETAVLEVPLEEHYLILDPTKLLAACKCGEKFKGKSYPAMTKEWAAHIAELKLLDKVVEAVRQEHQARLEGERLIGELMAAGVSSNKIAEAIGTNGEGKPIISSTVIQRVGKERMQNPNKPPRRRKAPARNGSASQAKKTVKKAPAKKAAPEPSKP